MLSDVRVLEISSPPTMLAGQIFGDLGADVVALEPPQGAPGRRLPPFIGDVPGLERSLTWHALNRNKRGLTLDPATSDGSAILETLLPHFDVLIEAFAKTSVCAGLQMPEKMIVCEIGTFSRNGPKSGYRATDPVLMAAGGAPAMAGDPVRAPLFFPVPQAMMEAGAEAAVAALAALAARDRLGVSQTVEVQARVATTLGSLGRLVTARSGDGTARRVAPAGMGRMPAVPGMYACKDGFVAITVAFLPAFVAMTQRIAEWLVAEEALPAEFAALNLQLVARNVMTGETPPEPIERLIAALTETCLRKTKAELTEIARRHRFMAAPAMDMADIAAFEHYRVRGLFTPQQVGAHAVDVPARFAQFSDYSIEVRRPAPALSEHTSELLMELAGLNTVEIQALFAEGVI